MIFRTLLRPARPDRTRPGLPGLRASRLFLAGASRLFLAGASRPFLAGVSRPFLARALRLFRAPPAAILGQVDHANDGILRGWAWQPDLPRRRLVLDVFHRGIFLGQAFAGAYREDLVAHGIGDGRHGFIFHLPGDALPFFAFEDVAVVTAGPARQVIAMPGGLGPPGGGRRGIGSDPRQLLRPYLAALRGRGGAATPPLRPGRRCRVDAFWEQEPGSDLSAFVVHVARKYGRPFAVADQPALLHWYLEAYATERGPKRAPLSRRDLSRMLEARERDPAAAGLHSGGAAGIREAYRWAAEESCRLFVEDCLVTQSEEARLRAAPAGDGDAYPLSAFMRMYHGESAMLRRYRCDRERDRRAIYVLLLIVALRRPCLVNYMPAPWLRRLFDADAPAEAALRRLFGARSPFDAAMLRQALEAAGVSTTDWSWRPHRYRGHRILGAGAVAGGPAECDIQLVGPFRSNTGLGESCRRIARALLRTTLSVNLVDYAIGGAKDALDADLPLAGLRCARANLLHLNLEEVPEALASLPDVFSGRPTVAMPYWELSSPAAVHRLGLALVDELWVASRFLAAVFASTGVPVRRIGMSCDEAPAPAPERRDEIRRSLGVGPSTFLFLAALDARSWMQRKNPIGVVEAFQAAFAADSDVALVVKTHNTDAPLLEQQKRYWHRVRDLCAADPRIILVDELFAGEKQRLLLAAADCLVTLHRAEGLGLDALDALGIGTPVVATAYSGVLDLCTPETAWLVAAERVAVAPSDYSFVEPGHVWAAPDPAAAAAALRSVHRDRHGRLRKVEAGRRLVGEEATLDALARRLEACVRQLLAAVP